MASSHALPQQPSASRSSPRKNLYNIASLTRGSALLALGRHTQVGEAAPARLPVRPPRLPVISITRVIPGNYR